MKMKKEEVKKSDTEALKRKIAGKKASITRFKHEMAVDAGTTGISAIPIVGPAYQVGRTTKKISKNKELSTS